jgi:hypothetical protein
MRSLFSLGCALFLLNPFILAQVKIIGETAPPPPPSHTQVTVSDVIKMSNAGLSDEMIIQQIQKNAQPFDLSPDQLVRLKQNSVSERVIRAMMPTPAAPPTTAASGTTAPATPSEYPTEVGVYAKEHSQWREVLPEIVNWKSGGVLKNTVTIGIIKQDVNGHLKGRTSHTELHQPIEFAIVTREGDAITEYQLLHLNQNSDNREFRTVTGGVLHVSSGARDTVPFQWTKVAPRTFTITLNDLQRGEYGILPPDAIASKNAAGSQGKLYTFGVGE